ncbi:hypothetical protein [Brachybacterium sacelli]|uniref:ABC transporter permease n=1 Tax=Brachybacterium sacelli TaxID=173364 RepID=A0ABS4WXF1_9MICO|nr:hypothetical protein [Brachybacterium sacelli]MBP2380863.1 hypothetical protein [Brachybacterium sacelli]
MSRRMAAPWAALIAMTISQIVILGQEGMPWRGEVFWSLITVEAGMLPALLITAVAVCVDARVAIDPQRMNLLATGDLRARYVTRYAATTAACFVAPVLVAGALVSLTWPEYWGYSPMASTVHLLVSLLSTLAILSVVLCVAVAGGIVGPIVGVLAALWLGVTALGEGGLVTIGSSTGSMLGFAPSWGSLAAQAVASVIAIGVSTWAVATWAPSIRGLSWRRIGAFAVLVILAASPALALTLYVPTTDGRLMCYGDGGQGMRTCVAEQHERLLDPLHERFEEFRAAAQDAGVEDALPHTVVESYTLTRTDTVQSNLRISGDVADWRPTNEELGAADPEVSRQSVAEELAMPSHCPQVSADVPPSDAFWKDYNDLTDAYLTLVDEEASSADQEAAAADIEEITPGLQQCDF